MPGNINDAISAKSAQGLNSIGEQNSFIETNKYVSQSVAKATELRAKELEVTKKLIEAQKELNKLREQGVKETDKAYKEQIKLIGELKRKQQEQVKSIAEGAQKYLYEQASLRDKAQMKYNEAVWNREQASEKRNEIASAKAYRDVLREQQSGYDKNSKEYQQLQEQIDSTDRLIESSENAAENFDKTAKSAENTSKNLDKQDKALDNFKKALSNAVVALASGATKVMDEIVENSKKYGARLQGITGQLKDYEGILKTINKNVGLSPFVSQRGIVNTLNTLLERGILYNLEQRAFLAEISEKVAATFDKQNEALERLIRLQQSDSTAARLGLEASLTGFFNEMFEDTSYLASNLYDAVTSSLIEAESQMTKEQAVSFEYTIQRWLGSLSSLGLSQSAVSSIASGIGLLGSGNVQALSGTPIETLLALSAGRAGLSYSDLLINSIDNSSANELLKSMVEYLKEIADSNNLVVKSAYGNILGLSQSDFRALKNITGQDIASIYKAPSTYSSAMSELDRQLSYSTLSSRVSLKGMMGNLWDNFMYSWGSSMARTPGMYLGSKINELINQMTGGEGIPIPTVSGLGNFFGANANLNNMIFAVASMIPLVGSLANIRSASLNNITGFDLSKWGGKEYTSRGSGFTGIKEGITRETSLSEYTYSGSSEDMEKRTLSEQYSSSKERNKQLGIEDTSEKDFNKSERTFDDLYNRLFGDGGEKGTIRIDDTVDPYLTIKGKLDNIETSIGIAEKSSVISLLSTINNNLGPLNAYYNTIKDKGNVNDRIADAVETIRDQFIFSGIGSDDERNYSLPEAITAILDSYDGGGRLRVMVSEVDDRVPGFGGGILGKKIQVDSFG